MNIRRLVFAIVIAFTFVSWHGEGEQILPNPEHVTFPAVTVEQSTDSRKQRILEEYGKTPMSFEANQGQTDPEVKFIARGSGYSLFLTPTEAVLSLSKPSDEKKEKPGPDRLLDVEAETDETKGDVLRLKLVGANASPRLNGIAEQAGVSNYFTGNDSTKWSTNVPHFSKVSYANVYPGIDMVFYGNQDLLEYDFVVASKTDPNLIRIAFDGSENSEITADGDLVLRTSHGQISQKKPIAYQEINGVKSEVAANYIIRSDKSVGFELGEYDKAEPLIIDPILEYSTYFGGVSQDVYALAIETDVSGNAYIAGYANSLLFPTSSGAFQPARSGCSGSTCYDAFITKLNSTGTALVYSTYLGGSDNDSGISISVDQIGNAYLAGNTSSGNFPTTLGSFQQFPSPTLGNEAFVTKLDPSGANLIYSTYLSSDGQDSVDGIDIDSNGNAFVTGSTNSSDFPVFNALRGFSGRFDGFVTKINATGSSLLFSTFLGGSSDDGPKAINIDAGDNVIVVGTTASEFGFPIVNAVQTAHRGCLDVFVTKLNSTGSAISFSTYLGGTGCELGYAVDSDLAGNIYITGEVRSFDFPTTTGAFQRVKTGSAADAFILKMNATGIVSYSTYVGGGGYEIGKGIAVDNSGNVHITGVTSSTDFPVMDSLSSLSGNSAAFVTKVNAAGSALMYSTLLGGNFDTAGNDLALNQLGNAYVTGRTNSTTFPTNNALQSTNLRATTNINSPGQQISFISKLKDLPPNQIPTADAGNDQTVECQGAQTSVSLDGTNSSDPDGDNLSFVWKEGVTILGTAETLNVGCALGSHAITLRVTDPLGATSEDSIIVEVVNSEPPLLGEYSGGPVNLGSANTLLPSMPPSDAGGIQSIIVSSLGFTGSLSVDQTTGVITVSNASPAGAYTVNVTATDNCGATTTRSFELIVNSPPGLTAQTISRQRGDEVASSTVAVVHDDLTSAGGLTVTIGTVPSGITVSNAVNNSGTLTATLAVDCTAALGENLIPLTVTDPGGLSTTGYVTVNVAENPMPTAAILGPPSGYVYPLGSTVVFTGAFTDNTGDMHTASWRFGGDTVVGSVNEASSTTAASYTFNAPGVYLVNHSVTDACGGMAVADTVNGDLQAMVVIYDPNGGFVTGGGWITSPVGAYTPDMSMTGKASFGFVSKYQPGATVPTGNTEFQFRAANFNFKSTNYDWLVVSGSRGQYRGSGTINGMGNYRFMLTVIDGQANGGGGTDKFRLRIWDDSSGGIIYDNQVNGDTSDAAPPATVIGGGSIVIHRH